MVWRFLGLDGYRLVILGIICLVFIGYLVLFRRLKGKGLEKEVVVRGRCV